MKIAAPVMKFALKHRINVRRDHTGDYTVFSRSPQRHARFFGTAKGALAYMRRNTDSLSNGPESIPEVDEPR
jgi:hypothetical protein